MNAYPFHLTALRWKRVGQTEQTIRATVRFRSGVELVAEIRYKGKGAATDPAAWTLAIEGYFGTRAELMATAYLDANRDHLIPLMVAACQDEAVNVDEPAPLGLFADMGGA